MALRVRLGDQREVLARALARELEREAVDALDALAGEDRGLGGDLLGQSLVHAAAGAGVFALGVLPDDDPVDILKQHLSTPGRTRAGRTFAYWSKPWQIGRRRPQSETWSGTSGAPTAPKKIASKVFSSSRPPRGM